MAKCIQTAKKCQAGEAELDYGFDWTREFARKWAKDKPFGNGVTVRPLEKPATGFQYRSSGGQSGEFEPSWPRADGGEVVDGSITWTAEPYTTDSYKETIASDTWSASSPIGLTVTPVAPTVNEGEQLTAVVVSGGTVGRTYTIENEVVTSEGYEYVARLLMTIE